MGCGRSGCLSAGRRGPGGGPAAAPHGTWWRSRLCEAGGTYSPAAKARCFVPQRDPDGAGSWARVQKPALAIGLNRGRSGSITPFHVEQADLGRTRLPAQAAADADHLGRIRVGHAVMGVTPACLDRLARRPRPSWRPPVVPRAPSLPARRRAYPGGWPPQPAFRGRGARPDIIARHPQPHWPPPPGRAAWLPIAAKA